MVWPVKTGDRRFLQKAAISTAPRRSPRCFKVLVEKHGINGHLRQKGKIAELALGYGGSVGALKGYGCAGDGPCPKMSFRSWSMHGVRSNTQDCCFLVGRRPGRSWKLSKHQHMLPKHYGLILFTYRSGMLFITLPSGQEPRLRKAQGRH
jgi:DNA polymerase